MGYTNFGWGDNYPARATTKEYIEGYDRLFTKWKPVVGFENRYEVSSLGEVRNIKTKKIRKVSIDKHGYQRLSLEQDGTEKKKNMFVHRLVAMAFLENPESLPCINHINENKLDNNVKNLEWCTVCYNNRHSKALPYKLISPEGEVVTGKSLTRFCDEQGLSQRDMWKVLNKKVYQHKGWTLPDESK